MFLYFGATRHSTLRAENNEISHCTSHSTDLTHPGRDEAWDLQS